MATRDLTIGFLPLVDASLPTERLFHTRFDLLAFTYPAPRWAMARRCC